MPLGIPGVKFGFSNLVVLVCLAMYGFREALAMAFLKILLSTLLFNGFSSFLYTMGGTLASCLSMTAAFCFYKKGCISMIGISTVGGFFHVTSQYVIASYTLYTPAVFSMYGMAASLTLFTAMVMGFLAKKIIKQLQTISFHDE